ncbi:uncharacterized protein L199_007902 [Kwoniella botswanensis]|uniref:uncharacterized protein n=1 Tax=Kwoniella botswanensis TaxID=1268659 RepID=UPI00315C67CB
MTSLSLLFGLFINLATDPTEPSPIGNPIAQDNTVLVGVNFDFYYGALNQSFPIEINALLITTIFRSDRSSTHPAYGETSTKSDRYIKRHLHPTAIPRSEHCQGGNEQYANRDECMTFLNGLPLVHCHRLGENNFGCRYLHIPMLSFRPDVHCPHVGPSGGDMCVPRNYTEVVKAEHFPQGFAATPLEDRRSQLAQTRS